MKPEGWQNVVDVIEPILAQSWFDERWLNNELDRLEARSAFSTPGGLAALARYAHHARAGELLVAHSPNALALAVVQALKDPAGPVSERTLTWLLEQQLMRDPDTVRLLAEDRRPWAAAIVAGAGRELPPAPWISPWDPKKKPRAPAAVEVPTAPFEERLHAPIVAVPRSPASEQHEREWHQLEWQNTFHLRRIHDEAALLIWKAIDPRATRVIVNLADCAPRFGLAGLDKSLELLPDNLQALASFEPFETPRLARFMAHEFSARTPEPIAQVWLERFPEAAVVGLVPCLLARDKSLPEHVRALRHLRRHRPEAFERGLERYAPALRGTVVELLEAPAQLPTRKPSLPEFASVDRMPWLITRDGQAALRGDLLEDVLALLKVTPLEGAGWLAPLRAQFSEASLQRLAETLMRAWLFVGGPPKEKWALWAVAHFPSDAVVEFLGTTAAALAPSSLSARAREFLDVLAAMSTRGSLKQVYALSRKVRAKAFRVRAEQAFAAAADRMGMSHLELSERLVPDYGLTPEGVLPLTPPVRLVLEGLKAKLVDAGGKVLKALPAIADEEVATELAELKKRAAPLAREIAERLEQRMATGARMSVEHFTEVYAQHGIVRQVASNVLFGVYSGGKLRTPFVMDQGAVLSPDLSIGVVHPLELLESDRALWRTKLPNQPFEQLTRPTTAFSSPGSFEHAIRAFAGRSVSSGAILGLEKRGWVRGNVEGGGCYWTTARKVGGVEVVVEFEPGIYVGDPTVNPQQLIARVICAIVEEPPPLVMSELVNDLQKAFK